MLKNVKRRLLNWLLSYLFNAVTEEDALTYHNGKLVHEGSYLTKEDEYRIATEAGTIENMMLWQVMVKTMKWEANKKMYFGSTSDDDMVAGKWMLFTLDVLEKKIHNLTKLNK